MDIKDFSAENRVIIHGIIDFNFGRNLIEFNMRGQNLSLDSKDYKKEEHEWIFTKIFLKTELLKNPKLAIKFMMFCSQFYPKYEWMTMYDINNPLETVQKECEKCLEIFEAEDRNLVDELEFAKAMSFGSCITEFMVRYLDYSLVKVQNQKIIYTAQTDCDKKFFDYIMEGFSLQRVGKIKYVKLNDEEKKKYPNGDGYFKILPVYPTHKLDYPIDECIELASKSNGEEKGPKLTFINFAVLFFI